MWQESESESTEVAEDVRGSERRRTPTGNFFVGALITHTRVHPIVLGKLISTSIQLRTSTASGTGQPGTMDIPCMMAVHTTVSILPLFYVGSPAKCRRHWETCLDNAHIKAEEHHVPKNHLSSFTCTQYNLTFQLVTLGDTELLH